MQVLVIARIKPDIATEKVVSFVSKEAAKVWEFYAAEHIRQIHYIADMSGAVMLWEGESLEVVTQAVHQLPMAKEGILECDILPLKPYAG